VVEQHGEAVVVDRVTVFLSVPATFTLMSRQGPVALAIVMCGPAKTGRSALSQAAGRMLGEK